MKIAIDIKEAGATKAGKGYFTFHLLRNLFEIDKENEYLLYSQHKIPGFEEFPNVKQIAINSKGFMWHIKVFLDLQKQKIDLYFAPTSYIIPAFLPRKIRSIIVVHDLVAFLFKGHNKKAIFIEKLFLKAALKKSEKVVTVSQNTKNDLIERFDYPKSQIEVISCAAAREFQPIPKTDLTEFIKKTDLPEKFFLSVGTLEPRKNYLSLVTAFSKFHNEHPDYHLIIVGKNGWQYEDIYQQIKQTRISEKIHTLGYLSTTSLASLYSLATALVFPSFYEGFGIPPLEAMQCGCPVICSNNSSLPEVVGDAALLIDPQSSNQIAEAMHDLATKPALREKLREEGLTQAKKFSWKDSAEKFLEGLTF
ncbi:hypothetical protein COU74_05030 [Candidatus Peregrinibacteria bacterium CG10_big_fil_rev_8_21_14_0_10_36_19]|nr:MAG: hypothetical protein COU74_05030 [Candidatus Peregrinibacteria bacterium CG10_big_fil_rev_8_21_14_0_10_36_19]